MRPINFSNRARQDLIEIWDYIAQDSIDNADKLVARIEAAAQELSESPGLGHQRNDVSNPRILFWAVRPYLTAYRATRRTFHVIRIVHGARNFRRIF